MLVEVYNMKISEIPLLCNLLHLIKNKSFLKHFGYILYWVELFIYLFRQVFRA